MNEQTEYWKGEAGTEYTERHKMTDYAITNSRKFFEGILSAGMRKGIKSVMELGCNQGVNLAAIQAVLGFNPLDGVELPMLRGIEINPAAVTEARARGWNVMKSSVLEYAPGHNETYDLVVTKGLLIHIKPFDLAPVYSNIYNLAKKYIILAEYYAPKIEMIEYRGEKDRLWRAPHAEHMLDRYLDLRLLKYGFVSKLDKYPQDDITWWLLEKQNAPDK